MATKIKLTGMKPVEALTGTIQGKRFKVILDDLKVGDLWSPGILPVLQSDGIGKSIIIDGTTRFTFPTSDESTVEFSAKEGNLMISQFLVRDDGKAEA